MSRRILLVAPVRSVHTRRWINFFTQQGCILALVSMQAPEPDDPLLASLAGFYYLDIRRFWLRLPWLLYAFGQIKRTFGPELIHVHHHAYLGWLPGLLGFRPLVITLWGSDMLAPMRPWSKLLAERSLRTADLVTADAWNLLARARAAGARRCELLLFGIDPACFYPRPQRDLLRRHAGYGPADFVVLSPRALQPLYRIENIIAACALLREQGIAVCLLLLAFSVDLAYQERLRALIQSLSLAECVRWLPGQSHQDLAHLYSLADVVVSVPERDGTPVSFLEAMACGTPVLCAPQPAYAGIFTDGKDITFVASAAPPDLAAGLASLARGQLDRQNLILGGLDTAARYQAPREMGRMLGYYRELLGD